MSHGTVTSLATGSSGPVRRILIWPRKGVSGGDLSRAMKTMRGVVLAWGGAFRRQFVARI
jgi:hypothetical protein